MEEKVRVLKKFYEELYSNLLLDKKLKDGSIFISLFKINSNSRFDILEKSTLNSISISKKTIQSLLDDKLIRPTDKLNEYAITAKGVWKIEKECFGEEKLINFLDKDLFNIYKDVEKPLDEKEKVIIFAMVAIRALSQDAAIDLKKRGLALDTLKEIIDLSYEKLKSLGIISKRNKTEIYGGIEYESKLSSIFRRLTDLPKKTKGLYVPYGDSKYFLDLSRSNTLIKENLVLLLRKIFGEKKLNPSEFDEIYNFFCNIAAKKSILIFGEKGRIFSKPKYDEEIKESLCEIY